MNYLNKIKILILIVLLLFLSSCSYQRIKTIDKEGNITTRDVINIGLPIIIL